MLSQNALDGIRTIDFTHVLQGPLATQLLADFGADVIKIERAGMGDWTRGYGPHRDGMSLPFAGLNRNKRSVVVDVRTPAGKEVVLRLLGTADVLVHNFRPGVVQRLGLDYESLQDVYPRLIYACSSGWGDEGPYVQRQRKGHAEMAAATGGRFRFDGPDGLPTPPGISMDYPAGLLLANGILLALFDRHRTGRGQRVSTDLLSATVMAGAWDAPEFLNPSDDERDDHDLRLIEGSLPKVWRTRDGFIEVSPVFSSDALRDISIAMELGDLSRDPRFDVAPKRMTNKAELQDLLKRRFLEKTTAEWLDILEPRGVLCAEIKRFDEALQDPQVRANQMVVEVDRPGVGALRVLGTAVRLSRTSSSLRLPPPLLGEHTEEVLEEVGYSESDMAALRAAGVIPDRECAAALTAMENGIVTT